MGLNLPHPHSRPDSFPLGKLTAAVQNIPSSGVPNFNRTYASVLILILILTPPSSGDSNVQMLHLTGKSRTELFHTSDR